MKDKIVKRYIIAATVAWLALACYMIYTFSK